MLSAASKTVTRRRESHHVSLPHLPRLLRLRLCLLHGVCDGGIYFWGSSHVSLADEVEIVARRSKIHFGLGRRVQAIPKPGAIRPTARGPSRRLLVSEVLHSGLECGGGSLKAASAIGYNKR